MRQNFGGLVSLQDSIGYFQGKRLSPFCGILISAHFCMEKVYCAGTYTHTHTHTHTQDE